MNTKTITVLVYLAVIIVAIVAVVGLSKTGLVTTPMTERYCACTIERFDYYGNAIGTSIISIKGEHNTPHTNENCNTRCEQRFAELPGHYQTVRGEVAAPGLQRAGVRSRTTPPGRL